MSVYKNDYKIYPNHITYNPVAGPTISEAIQNALEIAKIEKKQVRMIINDIVLVVTEYSDFNQLFADYNEKLNKKRAISTVNEQQKS